MSHYFDVRQSPLRIMYRCIDVELREMILGQSLRDYPIDNSCFCWTVLDLVAIQNY